MNVWLTTIAIVFATSAHAVDTAYCVGDCDDNGTVEINELVMGVRVLLGDAQLSACPAIDCNQSGRPRITCMILAVVAAVESCVSRARCGFDCDGVCNGFEPGVCPCTTECIVAFDCSPGSICNDSDEQFNACVGELTCRAPQ